MSTSTDTFAAFVAVLVEALDPAADTEATPVRGPTGRATGSDTRSAPGPDSGLTGTELAARLHLSRFHLDRVVKAVSGESPGAFRRRILLERAAYRMVTTTAPLIDIALEAGYGSHAAFTRAFGTAYGRSPASWRRRPGQIRLASPNDVHFHPPGGIRLPAVREVTGMQLLTTMMEHHVWLTGEMIRVSGRLTPEQLDARIELDVDDDQQTIRSLLSRLVGQMGMWNAALADREYDWSVEEHESLTSLRRRLDVEGPTYLEHVRRVVAEDRLDETFVDALCEPAEVFTYGGNIAHVLTFAAHRRTLVALALIHHGIDELGWGDPARWVAQE